mmetsp:Transcript_27354/g.81988  ORF Transcript_27354/g.81988 Transcript_27354/m.81988 type:complete len:345 (-) Transcript_27354:1800-2834(-)
MGCHTSKREGAWATEAPTVEANVSSLAVIPTSPPGGPTSPEGDRSACDQNSTPSGRWSPTKSPSRIGSGGRRPSTLENVGAWGRQDCWAKGRSLSYIEAVHRTTGMVEDARCGPGADLAAVRRPRQVERALRGSIPHIPPSPSHEEIIVRGHSYGLVDGNRPSCKASAKQRVPMMSSSLMPSVVPKTVRLLKPFGLEITSTNGMSTISAICGRSEEHPVEPCRRHARRAYNAQPEIKCGDVIVGCDRIPSGVPLEHDTLIAALVRHQSTTLQLIDVGETQPTALQLHSAASRGDISELENAVAAMKGNLKHLPPVVEEGLGYVKRLRTSIINSTLENKKAHSFS